MKFTKLSVIAMLLVLCTLAMAACGGNPTETEHNHETEPTVTEPTVTEPTATETIPDTESATATEADSTDAPIAEGCGATLTCGAIMISMVFVGVFAFAYKKKD